MDDIIVVAIIEIISNISSIDVYMVLIILEETDK